MYAFIVSSSWETFKNSVPDATYAGFLRSVGTPCVKMETGTFNSVSGFWLKVEEGWGITFNSLLVSNDINRLNSSMESLLIS